MYYAWALITIVLMGSMAWFVRNDTCLQKWQKERLFTVVALLGMASLPAAIMSGLQPEISNARCKMALCIWFYSAAPLILLQLLRLSGVKGARSLLWAMIGANAAIHLSALFSSVCFTILEDQSLRWGPLGCSSLVTNGILLVSLLYAVLKHRKKTEYGELWFPVMDVLLIAGAMITDYRHPNHICPFLLSLIALMGGSISFTYWFHIQLAREHEREQEAEQRIQIMISQIQPHFLFNTLSTIQALCRLDPEKAFEITEKFGTYLRQNIDSLSHSELIPIGVELEHTRIYAEIEMIRFPSVRMEYEIQDDAFLVPALSVQPMVENAIRHGVRATPWGHVLVMTRREKDAHLILIRDNGVGFDPEHINEIEGSHIGIRNVRERVERFCGGTLEIESTRGKGTSVSIRIPIREESANEGNMC